MKCADGQTYLSHPEASRLIRLQRDVPVSGKDIGSLTTLTVFRVFPQCLYTNTGVEP